MNKRNGGTTAKQLRQLTDGSIGDGHGLAWRGLHWSEQSHIPATNCPASALSNGLLLLASTVYEGHLQCDQEIETLYC